ncbi:MAG TPA: hypothetical protein VHT74_06220 [Acetobacteraceae bacterium]|jgi:hypothetical protein|nr:hypothetical protein [Acetobacteraceae bacterium]
MNPTELQDRIHKALNSAARAIGADTDAYRPSGVSEPLAPMNRFLRLRAAFTAEDGRFAHPNAYGDALWYGVFDAAYTRIGDYLVQQDAIWFVAAQQRLLPVLCVQTSRVVSFWRPAAPSSTGVNAYGGVTTETNTPLLTNWPASVLGASGRGHPDTELPSDSSIPYWTVLLPAFPGVVLLPADFMTDDLGRNAVVAAAELTDLGWRVSVKQATT